VTPSFVGELDKCRPFGEGNAEPVFAMRDARIFERRKVGDNHMKMKVGDDSTVLDAIAFDLADSIGFERERLTLAVTPQFNTWNGNTAVQLKVVDID
jgi:single-stranded-DNA-specific exonuclease